MGRMVLLELLNMFVHDDPRRTVVVLHLIDCVINLSL